VKNVRTSGLSTIATAKYYDLQTPKRAESRTGWNKPVLWPALVLLFLFLAVLAPGVLTYYRERT
jgi:hypothetical protein